MVVVLYTNLITGTSYSDRSNSSSSGKSRLVVVVVIVIVKYHY